MIIQIVGASGAGKSTAIRALIAAGTSIAIIGPYDDGLAYPGTDVLLHQMRPRMLLAQLEHEILNAARRGPTIYEASTRLASSRPHLERLRVAATPMTIYRLVMGAEPDPVATVTNWAVAGGIVVRRTTRAAAVTDITRLAP